MNYMPRPVPSDARHTPETCPTPVKPYDEAIRAQLAQILESPGFVHAPRRKKFLSHVVEVALQVRTDELTEFGIGFAVFDRPDSFDPRMDSVVRVYATHVRKILRAYYETQGASGQVTIDLPVGSYVPVFKLSPKQQAPPELASHPPAIAIAQGAAPDPSDAAFCLGVIEETVNALVDSGRFSVLATSYAPGISGSRQHIARMLELGITNVLEVTTRRAESKVRVISRLLNPEAGYIGWKLQLDLEFNDTLITQEDIAKHIVSALVVYLNPLID